MNSVQIILALLRGAHLAAMMSLFGTLTFLTLVAPSALAEGRSNAAGLRRRLIVLASVSTTSALILGAAWLIVETAVIADANRIAMVLHALPVVVLRTQFGHWLLLRGGLLLVLLPLLRLRHPLIAVALAALALAVQPMLGHAGAIGGSVGTTLIISESVHVLAAGAWLGGLLPLFMTIGSLPRNGAATASCNFTPVGLSAVLVLTGTAVVQVAQFMGGLPGLLGTGYGHTALIKLGLFVMLLTLAALNRWVFTDRLGGKAPDGAVRHMRVSITTEAALGALVIIVAAILGSQTPATHEQPVWPFAWRPSLSVFYEPELRGEVIVAMCSVGLSIGFAITGVVWRRLRWPALIPAAIILAMATPHFDLLFVEAYPTSFFTSPTEFAATAVARGARLFSANCVSCHGSNGRGDGIAAKVLPIPPADLTAEHLWAHSDGDLFWYISHGFEGPASGVVMPGFAGILSSEARWDLIDYLRAHNAGESMRTTNRWSHPVPAPQFDVVCGDGRTIDLDDLRGRMLLIIAASSDESTVPALPPAGPDMTIILLTRQRIVKSDRTMCVASEPETWTSFAILLGVSNDALEGEQVLVDQNAWLRAAWRREDPQSLAAMIRDIASHPLSADEAGGHLHQH